MKKNIVVLLSGRGSNLEAIVAAQIPGVCISAVIANRSDAGGLDFAREQGIEAVLVDHRFYEGREQFDEALAAQIDIFSPDLVVLAGFMRVLTSGFVRHYEGRLLNIHPSLLPSFAGLYTHKRALETGVKVHGTTVHFVTAELDNGPIVIQAVVPVFEDDTEQVLAARVLEQEHRIYPQAIRWFVEERLSIHDGKVKISGAKVDTGLWCVPCLE